MIIHENFVEWQSIQDSPGELCGMTRYSGEMCSQLVVGARRVVDLYGVIGCLRAPRELVEWVSIIGHMGTVWSDQLFGINQFINGEWLCIRGPQEKSV